MKYLFAFADTRLCYAFGRDLKKAGIYYEIRNAQEFPDGTQGPEIWVRDEDHENAKQILFSGMREQ